MDSSHDNLKCPRQSGDAAGVRDEDALFPTFPFLLQVRTGVNATGETANRRVMGSGLLKNNHPISSNDDNELVSGLQLQRLARDHNLIFR